MLSRMIWERMSRGVAPMARRMPISVVRSLTVTIMMLLTPITPARMVPSPTSQIRKLTPLKRLSTRANICSVLMMTIACLSLGSKKCCCEMICRIRGSSSEIRMPE